MPSSVPTEKHVFGPITSSEKLYKDFTASTLVPSSKRISPSMYRKPSKNFSSPKSHLACSINQIQLLFTFDYNIDSASCKINNPQIFIAEEYCRSPKSFSNTRPGYLLRTEVRKDAILLVDTWKEIPFYTNVMHYCSRKKDPEMSVK